MGSAVILSGMVDRLRGGSQHYRYQKGVRLREGGDMPADVVITESEIRVRFTLDDVPAHS